MDVTPQLTPERDDETREAYLFQWGRADIFAISPDSAGSNLPKFEEDGAWQRREKFWLGVNNPPPAPINPEPVLRGLQAHGYFVWREGHTLPFGTSQ